MLGDTSSSSLPTDTTTTTTTTKDPHATHIIGRFPIRNDSPSTRFHFINSGIFIVGFFHRSMIPNTMIRPRVNKGYRMSLER
eukprot:scaffold375_cov157-Amphora_coffeaeformis.AAC.6